MRATLNMAKEGGWMDGRTKAIRALFTPEEHQAIRLAAARAGISMSRFVIQAAVAAAREPGTTSGGEPPAPPPPPTPKRNNRQNQ